MKDSLIYKLVDTIRTDNKSESQELFNSVMMDKVKAAVENKKIEVAGKIYNNETDN